MCPPERVSSDQDGVHSSLPDSLKDTARAIEQGLLERARAHVLRGDFDTALITLKKAIAEYPDSLDLGLALAGVYQQTGRLLHAEALLRKILVDHPADIGTNFLLARMLSADGRLQAMASVFLRFFSHGVHDADVIIQAVEMLDEGGRQKDAAEICDAELARGCEDARLHAYAAMQHIQLGNFMRARELFTHAIANDSRAFQWNIPVALSSLQRYDEAGHPDFEMFRHGLQQSDLDDRARTSLLFALGKACDDVGDHDQAARYFRDGNSWARKLNPWSRKQWHSAIASRLTAKARRPRESSPTDWTPIFIVGVPRSGTTLTAELLSRHPDVCNRGELRWLPMVAQQLERSGHDDMASLEKAVSVYNAQLLRDDLTLARWFIDKEPLNLLRVDLIMSMYPNARIIFCQRNSRDTAISLWSQYFTAGSQAYSYDLADIAVVIQSCKRMMAHWLKRYADSIHVVQYDDLVGDPGSSIHKVAAWLGLSDHDYLDASYSLSAISTGSIWQARQPVYKHSVERWRHYSPYLPELLRMPER